MGSVGLVEEAKRILEFLRLEISSDTYVNIMEQYRPTFTVQINQQSYCGAFEFPRRIQLQPYAAGF